jgi:cytochrome c-type biogenesis protein CcmH
MKNNHKLSLVLVLLIALLAAVSPAFAQDPEPTPSDDEVNAVAENIYCHLCEGITVKECETQACADWREEIRDLLAEGKSQQEIIDVFVQRYGDQASGVPPRKGLNWVLFIVAPLGVLVGLTILIIGFRSWRRPIETLSDMKTTELSAEEREYISRMEDDLKKRQ